MTRLAAGKVERRYLNTAPELQEAANYTELLIYANEFC